MILTLVTFEAMAKAIARAYPDVEKFTALSFEALQRYDVERLVLEMELEDFSAERQRWLRAVDATMNGNPPTDLDMNGNPPTDLEEVTTSTLRRIWAEEADDVYPGATG